MRNFIILILFVLGIYSCGSKPIFLDHKHNYIIVDKEKYISANFKSDKILNQESEYQFKIVNAENRNINIFSTVLENSLMFYSKENYKKSGQTITFSSYYKSFMTDVTHSGEKKFNFIVIAPNDSLTINIKSNFVHDVQTMRLKYYYFISNDKPSLINIDKTNMLNSTINVSLRK